MTQKKRWCGYSQWQKADEQQKLDGLKDFLKIFWTSAQNKYFFFSFKHLYFLNFLLLSSTWQWSAEISGEGFYGSNELILNVNGFKGATYEKSM